MKYSIGIDLGTTNCALAYLPLEDSHARSQVLRIPQWETPGSLGEQDTLPSFLYLPTTAEKEAFAGAHNGGDWIPGIFARKQAADRPDAVAHSAKSWLCHHAVDRSEPILPWGSREIAADEKISPIRASALLLNYLRHVWNSTVAADDRNAAFDGQQIIVTVPASFDAVAQNLTIEAARAAGFPDNVRLLEEPQAVFYRWLENHPESGALRAKLPQLASGPQHILVVDIGGGTSDFSLFEIQVFSADAPPAIKRVAVSDHILLGGDNIDLAIAHLIEPRFGDDGERGQLTAKQWNYLIARCRDLKERVLAEDDEEDGTDEEGRSYSVSIPATGSGLFAGTQSAGIARDEISKVLFEGFFLGCGLKEIPERPRAALREMGLPYAADSAITRHLAAFLNGRPRVDAILFNGGTLTPPRLRRRLVDQVASWQEGVAPAVLENPEPNLAVARGAAHYGALARRKSGNRIQAGAARAIYLEVAGGEAGRQSGGNSLVCILPRDTQPGEDVVVVKPELRLQLNRKVAFQPWYSTRDRVDKAGSIRPMEPARFHRLPPLHTIVNSPERGAPQSEDARIPVQLRSELNAVGLLSISCLSTDPETGGSWPLEFDLRALHGGNEVAAKAGSLPGSPENEDRFDPGVDTEKFAQAGERIAALMRNPPNRRDPVTPTRLAKSLEKILDQPKAQWNGALVRGLWPVLDECFDCRATSVDHEETWISFAGFLLRPGYGAALDGSRIDQLWRLHESGLAFPGKRIKIQAYVLWRRVAGGLDRARQTILLEPELPRLLREAGNPPADLVRLAGSLERIDAGLKHELVDLFLEMGVELARADGHSAPYFAALAGLLSRTPLNAGPETVLPAETVEKAFEATRNLDWSTDSSAELRTLFLRAGRLTGDRHLDVPKSLGKQLFSKLEKAGVQPGKLNPLRAAVPLARADRAQLFGEGLPPGLSLGDG